MGRFFFSFFVCDMPGSFLCVGGGRMCPRARVIYKRLVRTYYHCYLLRDRTRTTEGGFRLSFFPDGQILSHEQNERERVRASPTSYIPSPPPVLWVHTRLSMNIPPTQPPNHHPQSLSLSFSIRVTKLDQFSHHLNLLCSLIC